MKPDNETAAIAIENLAMYINHAASTVALRDGMQEERILWPWRGDDPKGRRHLHLQEASPERVRLCERHAALLVQTINEKTPR